MPETTLTCTRARESDLAAFALERAAAEWAEFRAHYPLCADCSREVARFASLAAALEREAPALHPAEAELLGFIEAPRGLGPAARERVRLHLEGCAACRSEVAALKRFDLSALGEPKRRPISEWIREALGLGPASERQWGLPALLHFGLRRPAFALVVAVVVSLSIWLGRDPAVAPIEAPAPQLAEREAPASSALLSGRPVVTAPAPPAPQADLPPPEGVARAPEAAPAPSVAQQPPAQEPRAPQTLAPEPVPAPPHVAALIPRDPPRYAPGALAAGPIVRLGGVGRGAGGETAPQVLAPAQIGLTAEPAPTLYWFLSERVERDVAISVVSDAAPAPLVEVTLAGPHAPGVHALSLADRGVRLEPGVDHRWFVAVIRDPERRSRDLVSSAAIRFAPPSAEAATRLATAAAERAHALAEAGFWYDAFDQLARWSTAEPESALLREHRAALLDQVGLAEAAGSARGPF